MELNSQETLKSGPNLKKLVEAAIKKGFFSVQIISPTLNPMLQNMDFYREDNEFVLVLRNLDFDNITDILTEDLKTSTPDRRFARTIGKVYTLSRVVRVRTEGDDDFQVTAVYYLIHTDTGQFDIDVHLYDTQR